MAVDIGRALRDKAYLDSLNRDEVKELLDKAAGNALLSEEELKQVAGGLPPDRKYSGCLTTGGSCLACKRSELLGC